MEVMYIADLFLYIRDDQLSAQHTSTAQRRGRNATFAQVIQSDYTTVLQNNQEMKLNGDSKF